MSSRHRVLEAIAGRPTDRVPVHFEFGPAGNRLQASGVADPDAYFGVDLKKIWFLPEVAPQGSSAQNSRPRGGASEPTPSEESSPPEEPATSGGGHPAAPHVGDERQFASYRLWGYAPERLDRRHPLIDCRRPEDLAEHRFPGLEAPGEAERLKAIVRRHHAAGLAVAGQIPYLGGVVFETAYRLRGLDNLLEDIRTHPDFSEALLDRITDNAARNVAILAATGADIVFLGDDIGMPTSMLISPQLWRRWFKPRLARVIAAARAVAPGVPVAYHSDGWYWPVLDDLVEIGVGILNPVQPDCMDPQAVRRRYGRRLALWGTVGSATLMPFGTPRQVYDEVRLRVEQLGQRAGLILSPAYDLEDDVPLANIGVFFSACGRHLPSLPG